METLEQLQARHHKEQRDLQARITQKKKAATKKTRKGLNTECDELERTLKDKQQQELAVLSGDSVPSIDDVPELDQDSIDEDVPPTSSNSSMKDPVNGLADALQESSIPSTPKSEDGEGRKRNRQKERLARTRLCHAEIRSSAFFVRRDCSRSASRSPASWRRILENGNARTESENDSRRGH